MIAGYCCVVIYYSIYILSSTRSTLAYNALLRCEQRNTDAAACHLNHLKQRIVKMPRVANHS
ncbi:hypothetical protein DA098_28210 [Vibrio parahaemolyticus]|nr:hypothetical protein DA098_28210 [Vibrio parahaemolyticus]TMX79227.1 hypothetical protein DA094_08805 [Vibrio parahaemolyticus]